MSALSFQPAERDVRYQTTIQHHWSKKWKHFSWSASGTKFRNLMAAIGLASTSDYSDYPKAEVVHYGQNFRFPWHFLPLIIGYHAHELSSRKARNGTNTTKSFFILQQCNLDLSSLLLLFLCVHRRDERPVAKQTAFQSFIVDDGVDDRELKKLSCFFFFEMWF